MPNVQGSSQAESKVGKESTGLKQGRPVVLMDCRILDDSGEEITSWDGTHPGHLHVRGPNVITAYYKVRRWRQAVILSDRHT